MVLRQEVNKFLDNNVKKCWRCKADLDISKGKYRAEIRCSECGLIITLNTTTNRLLSYSIMAILYSGLGSFCIGIILGALL